MWGPAAGQLITLLTVKLFPDDPEAELLNGVNLRTLNKPTHVCLKVSLQQIRGIFEKKKRSMKCGGEEKKPQGALEKCLNGGKMRQ